MVWRVHFIEGIPFISDFIDGFPQITIVHQPDYVAINALTADELSKVINEYEDWPFVYSYREFNFLQGSQISPETYDLQLNGHKGLMKQQFAYVSDFVNSTHSPYTFTGRGDVKDYQSIANYASKRFFSLADEITLPIACLNSNDVPLAVREQNQGHDDWVQSTNWERFQREASDDFYFMFKTSLEYHAIDEKALSPITSEQTQELLTTVSGLAGN